MRYWVQSYEKELNNKQISLRRIFVFMKILYICKKIAILSRK